MIKTFIDLTNALKNPLPESPFPSPGIESFKALETLAEISRKATSAQVRDGTSHRVPMRQRNLESVNRKRYIWILTERLLPMHSYPTRHREMAVRSLVITVAYREGAVGQKI